MHTYKVYFFDMVYKSEYPAIVKRENINDLCQWLNSFTKIFQVTVLSAYLLDKYGAYMSPIHFLPSELKNQRFMSDLENRLLAYHEGVS